jgi:hypothetical protein
MLYNTRQPYTPALELYELGDRSLIIDTETVGSGPEVEIVEIAFGNCAGEIVYHSLVHRHSTNSRARLKSSASTALSLMMRLTGMKSGKGSRRSSTTGCLLLTTPRSIAVRWQPSERGINSVRPNAAGDVRCN